MILDKKLIAERIVTFINQRFDSIRDAANKMQLSENTLRTSYLTGKSLPGFEALLQFEKFGCDLHWLFTGQELRWNKFDSGITQRIESTLRSVKRKYQINEKDLELKSFEKNEVEFRPRKEWEKFDVCFIINNWKKHNSLRPHEMIRLAEYAEVDFSWLMTGSDDNFEKYLKGLFLSFPEIELLVKLKKNPHLLEKLNAYLDAKQIEDEIESIKIKEKDK